MLSKTKLSMLNLTEDFLNYGNTELNLKYMLFCSIIEVPTLDFSGLAGYSFPLQQAMFFFWVIILSSRD